MRLVKLNRRYKVFKDFGHTWAFRFDSYEPKAVSKIEGILLEMYGSQYTWKTPVVWRACFGHRRVGQDRPYWISFTNEADASVILLQMEHEQ